MSANEFAGQVALVTGASRGIGDTVKDIISQQGDHIKHLETFIKGHGVA